MDVLNHILQAHRSGHHMLALLLDPDKTNAATLDSRLLLAPDLILIGGSTGTDTDTLVRALRPLTKRPLVLFPGCAEQFTPAADALLYLSVLSGRNPDMLVGRHIDAARRVMQSGIESIPMGYILVDGGKETSVMRATGTHPIPQTEPDTIVDTAIAAQLLGKQLVYLEAGSGALQCVRPDIIRAVRSHITLPLIVGGGIRTPEQMRAAYAAGADMVVIGNHFEQHPEDIDCFVNNRIV